MAETDPNDDAGPPFHELRGDYVENAGQVINLREYLDYFEPLGSALSRLPDGTGGPFVHRFTDSGGRTVGSLGWVVSAASKRFGGWKLWGMWSNRPMPPVAFPLFWSVLADADRVSDWVARANESSRRLLRTERWPELLEEVKTTRLREEPFRMYLKAELSRAYAVPLPHRHPIEIELTPRMLDLLPWLYLLGPVDPAAAQLQPSRFNGVGYQYILSDRVPEGADAEITDEIDAIVDSAATGVVAGWRKANDLRARRNRPRLVAAAAPRPTRRPVPVEKIDETPEERNDMRTGPTQPSARTGKPAKGKGLAWRSIRNETASVVAAVGMPLYRIAVLALLAWIAFNVDLIRKAAVAQPEAPAAQAATAPQDTQTVAPVYEPDVSTARVRRVAAALAARPPRGIRASSAVMDDIARGGTDAADKLARVAVEVFLRRNGCFERAEQADGRFSAAEQRAIRNCAVLQDERLMKDGTQPDAPRAIQWLEKTVSAN